MTALADAMGQQSPDGGFGVAAHLSGGCRAVRDQDLFGACAAEDFGQLDGVVVTDVAESVTAATPFAGSAEVVASAIAEHAACAADRPGTNPDESYELP